MEESELLELICAGRLDRIGGGHGFHDTSVGNDRPPQGGCGLVAGSAKPP
jgi:hypothetical protein